MRWCLQHTADDTRALNELARVTKPHGYLYLLAYATGGIRWPLIKWLRPLAAQIEKPAVERAIELAELPANKRRTFVDDLFTPRVDFYHWDRLERMLREHGFDDIRRWGPGTRLDHEADLRTYREDLESLALLFAAGQQEEFGSGTSLFHRGHEVVRATIGVIRWFEDAVKRGDMSYEAAMGRVIGQGHHRVLAMRAA